VIDPRVEPAGDGGSWRARSQNGRELLSSEMLRKSAVASSMIGLGLS
jgi:hypothetical protein